MENTTVPGNLHTDASSAQWGSARGDAGNPVLFYTWIVVFIQLCRRFAVKLKVLGSVAGLKIPEPETESQCFW